MSLLNKRASKRWFAFLFSLLMVEIGVGYSQEYSLLNQYTLGDGLPSRQVLDVDIDETGYIWLATPNGFSRFDGYEFLNFDSTNTQGLDDHRILSLAVAGNLLWLGTYSHIYTFDLRTYKASKFLPSKGAVRDLFADKAGRVWFSHEVGAVNFIEDNKLTKVQSHHNEEWTKSTVNLITSFGEDERGVWWGRLDGSVHYYKTGLEPLELFVAGKDLKKRGTVIPVSDSTAVLFSTEMAYILDKSPNSNGSQILSNKLQGRGKFSHLISDKELLHIDGQGNVFEISFPEKKVEPAPKLTEAISSGSGVNGMIVSDNLWWFASNDGLIKIRRRPDLFSKVLTGKSASVRSIRHFGKNQTLVSAYNGLYYLNEYLEVESHNNYPYKVFQQFDEGDSKDILAIEENIGMMKLDTALSAFTNLSFNDDHLSYQCFAKYGNDIYLGTFMGLYKMQVGSDSLSIVRDKATGMDIGDIAVQDLHIRNNQLWIGTAKGLYKLNLQRNELTSVDEFTNIGIRDIYETDDQMLWLGTQERGLIAYNPESKSQQVFDHKIGLANNTVNIIASSDSENIIWAGTNNGLTAVDRRSQILTNYYKEDGLAHNEFNRKALTYDLNGNIWMGGLDGITVFDPNEFATVEFDAPQLILSGTGKYDGENDKVIFTPTSPSSDKVFNYGANDRLFRFRFALTDFENPQNNSFRYKIEGLHKDWVDLLHQRELLIDNLSPGEYTLLISGTNGKGFWSEPIKMELFVDYAFYQRVWFYIIILIAVIFIGVLIHKARVSQLLKIERMRVGIARDLHDELGSTLTRISMVSELSDGGKDSNDVASMSRDAASTLSDIVWSIDNTDDSLDSLLDRIKDHLYLMATDSSLKPKFSAANIPNSKHLRAEVKQHVFLITKEAINNSLKYSNGDSLNVNVEFENGLLCVHIADNGNSEEEASKITKGGNGLRNMQKRAEQMGGELKISKSNGYSVQLSVRI